MGRNDANPERTPASDPDIVRETRNSFQAVLDALDAARADLLRDERREPAEGPSRPQGRHDHPTGNVRPHQPFPPPASSASDEAPPAERMPPGPPPERPGPHRPTAVKPLQTADLRQADPPKAAAEEPPRPPRGLGSRPDRTPEAVAAEPPRSPGRPDSRQAGLPEAVAAEPPGPPGGLGSCGSCQAGTPEDLAAEPPGSPGEPEAVPPPPVVPAGRAHARRTGHRARRFTGGGPLRVAGIVGLGAASALLTTWLLIGHDTEPPPSSRPSGHMAGRRPASYAPENPSPPAAGRTDRPRPGASDPPLPEIPGTGVLRQGDSGHGVYELQVRLQQIPGIYDGGPVDGRYDAEVRAAVALFQKRYGIRGDEDGVYGAGTRLALMLRTK
ncbi:peptidoglycan-binding protein [Streptomyces sp. Caat 7-52]|uniref:peptidoglycan-binding domain-containing protein n=1 Tax=Streptomyces sp. Caat 7-52 TaxID=2949637 RepID=UPI002035874A|nr:peptidoglycan-binding protein [Streptomyces sp. Caat 7-52]